MYRYFFKRLMDFTLSLIAIIMLLPLFLILTPLVAIKMKGNPFFSQQRCAQTSGPFSRHAAF